MIAKIFETCFFDKHMLFPKETTLFPKKGAFFPKELGPFPKENLLLLEKVVFFTRELFLFHGELAWDWHLVFFCSWKLLPKSN